MGGTDFAMASELGRVEVQGLGVLISQSFVFVCWRWKSGAEMHALSLLGERSEDQGQRISSYELHTRERRDSESKERQGLWETHFLDRMLEQCFKDLCVSNRD